jgi:hypothetical protein
MYIMFKLLGWLARLLPSPGPTLAWSLIVRDRNLTGPWAGFSLRLADWSHPRPRAGTAGPGVAVAHCCAGAGMAPDDGERPRDRQARKPLSFNAASVVNLSDALAQRGKSGQRWRWLAPTPSQRQSCRYRGRNAASACEALP